MERTLCILTNGNDELHFFYDVQGRVAVVDYNGAYYRYMYNLQGDVIALVNDDGNKVVEYWYDAWGKPTAKNGIMSETLGKMQPFRYREYVFDEETGFYYLRSRYYRLEWGRFVNTDSLVNGNIYLYCNNNPTNRIDPTGRASKLGDYNNWTYEVLIKDNKFWGEAGKNDKIPIWVFPNGIIQMTKESWAYSKKDMAYGRVDCIGGARFIAKQFYRLKRYLDYNIRDTVSGIIEHNLSDGLHAIDPENLDAIPEGAVLFTYDQDHMGYFLGDFDEYEYCISETQNTGDVMQFKNLKKRLHHYNKRKRKYEGFYYWGVLNCIDQNDWGPYGMILD